ncbi:MAG: ASKHA domain-containing protein [Candidatus Thorarchaeota archaeon]
MGFKSKKSGSTLVGSNQKGISVDIGTTWISLHLLDLESGEVLGEERFLNPQHIAGGDLVSRIKYSLSSKADAYSMTNLVRDSVEAAIVTLLHSNNSTPNNLESVVIVGNSVMHHFFYDLPVDSLLNEPYHVSSKDPIEVLSNELDLDLRTNVPIYSPPLIESYVGSDAVAMILSSKSKNESGISVAIDVGTNTEISVMCEEGIWVTSAASGPAFEGMSLECGMAAEYGAIDHVVISKIDSRPTLHTIGNGTPRGLCGSGAVSAIASMLKAGVLNVLGSINKKLNSIWVSQNGGISHYILCDAMSSETKKPIYISQIDVRMLQQSKAAIFTATDLLLGDAGISPADVDHLHVTGSFGYGIHIDDAFRIGMLPNFANAEINQIPNGAILGADMIHRNNEARRSAEKIGKDATYVNLMQRSDFQELFSQAQLFPSIH